MTNPTPTAAATETMEELFARIDAEQEEFISELTAPAPKRRFAYPTVGGIFTSVTVEVR